MDKDAQKIFILLFSEGKIKKSRLKKIFDDFTGPLDKLKQKLPELGLKLFESQDELALTPNDELNEFMLQTLQKDLNEELSDAALQTLTLILYCGPISKTEIDFIRGVNSANSLRRLEMRALVNKKRVGMKSVYTPSVELLAKLNVSSQDELEGKDEFCKKIQEVLS